MVLDLSGELEQEQQLCMSVWNFNWLISSWKHVSEGLTKNLRESATNNIEGKS